MSLGVVLRLDSAGDAAIRAIWAGLLDVGVPSLATHTHCQHAPHVSLVVAESLDPEQTSRALKVVSRRAAVGLSLNAMGMFPQGVAFLAVLPTRELLHLQAQVHAIVTGLNTTTGPWPHSEPGRWTPHLTLGYGVTAEHAAGVALLLRQRLPVTSHTSSLWVENGFSGEAWRI